jgi:hypothetical protein
MDSNFAFFIKFYCRSVRSSLLSAEAEAEAGRVGLATPLLGNGKRKRVQIMEILDSEDDDEEEEFVLNCGLNCDLCAVIGHLLCPCLSLRVCQ